MLRLPSSPGPWPGASSHACARCGQSSAGIALGERCANCSREVARKAARIGRIVAGVTALLLAGYLMLTLRTVAPALQSTARTVGAAASVAWYVLTFQIVKRIALEWIR